MPEPATAERCQQAVKMAAAATQQHGRYRRLARGKGQADKRGKQQKAGNGGKNRPQCIGLHIRPFQAIQPVTRMRPIAQPYRASGQDSGPV